MLRVEHTADAQCWEAVVAARLEVDSEDADLAAVALRCYFFGHQGLFLMTCLALFNLWELTEARG